VLINKPIVASITNLLLIWPFNHMKILKVLRKWSVLGL
jgi:hypothetical protein